MPAMKHGNTRGKLQQLPQHLAVGSLEPTMDTLTWSQVVVSVLVQSTRYTIHGSDFQRASTPPSLETGDFVRCAH